MRGSRDPKRDLLEGSWNILKGEERLAASLLNLE